jgi:chanoclavine-I dehydrogenase
MESIASKVFAITGGASGMGLATCRKLAQLKAKAICIGDFNDKPFDVVRKELHALNPEVKVATTKLDVSSSSQVDAWINGIVQEFGALDGAVNAAGIPQEARLDKSPVILDETNDMWNRILAVNLSGVFYCNRAQIRAMVGLPKSPRSIVNIASLASMIHSPNCFSYGVSKAGIAYLTTSLSKDAAPYGIRVNTVSPSKSTLTFLPTFVINIFYTPLCALGLVKLGRHYTY